MPFPLVVLALPELVGWIASIFGAAYALFTWADGRSLDDIKKEIERAILNWVVAYAAEHAGLELDPDAPLSDASFCHAIEKKTGLIVRTLKDKNSFIEDCETFALQRISMKTGYTLSTLRNVDQMKRDLINIGGAVIVEKTGVPVLPLPDNPSEWEYTVRERVLQWAEAQIQHRVAQAAGEMFGQMSELVDVEGLAGQINAKLGEIGSLQQVNARGVALFIAEKVANQAIERFQVTAKNGPKQTRRRLQLLEAQRRFRLRHPGKRSQYIPIDPAAPIEPVIP